MNTLRSISDLGLAWVRTLSLLALMIVAQKPALSGEIPTEGTTLLPKGAEWKYLATGEYPGTTWMFADFDDSKWALGKAQLGFGDGDEVTVLPSTTPRTITSYFRASFDAGLKPAYKRLLVKLLRDDGAALYLNGKEILRDNLPAKMVEPDTLAVESVGTGENTFYPFDLDGSALLPGRNTVAVEVHQSSITSSDLSFDLELVGFPETVSELVIVSVVAKTAWTSEPSPLIRVIPGAFELSRTGNAKEPLRVFLGVGGSALPGLDYKALPEAVEFPPGVANLTLEVFASEDALIEEPETVSIELKQDAAGSYLIDPSAPAAKVVINDSTKPPTLATLEWVTPQEGEQFAVGSEITMTVVATDPDGYINRMEFFADDVQIGVSELWFFVAPPAGTPITHGLAWKGATEGKHVLTAQTALGNGQKVVSKPLSIVVGSSDSLPVISIAADQPDAMELPIFFSSIRPGKFTVKRTGDVGRDLTVFCSVGGTATPDQDYKALPSPLHFAAGEAAISLMVFPLSDEIPEGPETVVVRLEPDPRVGPGPLPDSYVIDPLLQEATVTITEFSPPSSLVLTAPKEGEVFPVGATIVLAATAVDPQSEIREVEFYQNDELVGVSRILTKDMIVPGRPRNHTFEWLGATAGSHVIQARAKDSQGQPVVSSSVKIVVGDVPAAVTLVSPQNGAVFMVGEPIKVRVETSFGGMMSELVVVADGQVIGKTMGKELTLEWIGATEGVHVLVGQAFTPEGKMVESAPVKVLVRALDSASFVQRDLPPAYVAGEKLKVVLRATPPSTGRAYAVEDLPPSGWLVGEMSDGGAVDPLSGRVKFGPFVDDQARSLTYVVAVPQDAAGKQVFQGTSAVDGKEFPITGDQTLESVVGRHPADLSSADDRITITELTAYAAAWKDGSTWPVGPSPVPISYLTRAGALWKGGENYLFDPAGGEAPLCWNNAPVKPEDPKLNLGKALRLGPGVFTPGEPASIVISVQPVTGVSAYAVQESLPPGWQVSAVNENGSVLAGKGEIRWGPFLGDAPKELVYTVTPPAGVASAGMFIGSASFDGQTTMVSGGEKAGAADAKTAPRIRADRLNNQQLSLQLNGTPGQICIAEVSTDLVHWVELKPTFLGEDGSMSMNDDVSGKAQKFYRLRVPAQ